MKYLDKICEVFGLSPEEVLFPPTKNVNAFNARGAWIYILREKDKMSFGNIAKEVEMQSRGNVYTEYAKIKDYYESNTYHLKEKIDKIMNMLNDLQSTTEKNTFEAEIPQTEQTDPLVEPTPETVSVEQSPLSEPVIERNIDTILRTETKSENETDFLKDLDDYQQFEQEQDQQEPDTIPEVSFQTKPNSNPNEVTIQMDDETADFSTDSILNMVEFGSVELACYYSQISEREVRELEQDGEVPPKSTEIVKEANENSRNKLEQTAAKKIKLLQEPLKKVLKKRNVSVSPESALILAFLMFAFSMFMTAKSIRKDNDYFLEKLRKMNTELKKEKTDEKNY